MANWTSLISIAYLYKNITMQIIQVTPAELEALIERSLTKIIKNTKPENKTKDDQWFDIDQLCSYHPDKPKKPTIYAWIGSRSIPHHKSGKKLRFLKSEIDAWLKTGKKKTIVQINAEV